MDAPLRAQELEKINKNDQFFMPELLIPFEEKVYPLSL